MIISVSFGNYGVSWQYVIIHLKHVRQIWLCWSKGARK